MENRTERGKKVIFYYTTIKIIFASGSDCYLWYTGDFYVQTFCDSI